MPYRQPTTFSIFIYILIITNLGNLIKAQNNGCDRYLKCRNDLLEFHWNCAEPLRRTTQHACKINHLYGDHKATSYNLESVFGTCIDKYSALNDIDYLLETDPSCLPSDEYEIQQFPGSNCWSELVRMTQKCYSMSKCCPSSRTCSKELENDILTEQFELEKSALKGLLEECAFDMNELLQESVETDDMIIAKKVGDGAKQLLKSVVPFRISIGPLKKNRRIVKKSKDNRSKEFAAPITIEKNYGRKPMRYPYGISRPKYSTYVKAGKSEVEPPTTSLRPFTIIRTGNTFPTSSTVPPPKTIDFKMVPKRKVRRGKNKRHRKKKHDFRNQEFLQRGSVISESNFDPLNGAVKLDKLSGNLKQKGEYISRSILPKMLLVKQNKGQFLGYAQPFIKPFTRPIVKQNPQSVDQIYDDIIESQIKESDKNLVENEFDLQQPELKIKPLTPRNMENEHFGRAFAINSDGELWTPDPKLFSTPTTTTTVPTTQIPTTMTTTLTSTTMTTAKATEPSTVVVPLLRTIAVKPSRITFPPFSKRISTIPTTTTVSTTTSIESTTENTTASPPEPSLPPSITDEELKEHLPSIDPLVDYVTHELLDKHMEIPSNEDELDFSNADYIDISAMDLEPSSSFPIARYELANNSTIWPISTNSMRHAPPDTTTPQVRTTGAPLNAAQLSEAQSNDLIPLPESADVFSVEGVTPSASVTTTSIDNQLWPLPIKRKRRLKIMGAKGMRSTKPIVIVPIDKQNEFKVGMFKKIGLLSEISSDTKLNGCQKYEKCLRKEIETRLKCAKPYPEPYDKCSAQLLPLYKLIDEASNDKIQFFINCISESKKQTKTCTTRNEIRESQVNCENLEKWSSYCKKLEECCPVKERCDAEAEIDHVGNRLRLLEKSFSLRAAACQFKHAAHRSLIRKL